MTGIITGWHERLKPVENAPKLEEIYKQNDPSPLTSEGESRYRRVLGQLAWAALSRADLCFAVSYLARFQSKPNWSIRSVSARFVALVVDAPSSRANHAFSGRITERRRALCCWFLRRVMER